MREARSGGRRFSGKAGSEYRLFLLARPYYERMQSEVGRKLRPSPRGRPLEVLDLGCGQGQTTKAMLRAARKARVTAVDNEPLMLREARESLRAAISSGRVLLVRSDALAFLRKRPPGSFDAVASAFMLHNVPKRYRTLVHREVFRVLRGGGIFVNADKFAEPDPARHRKSLEWQLRQLKRLSAAGRPDLERAWRKHYLDDEKPGRIMRERETVRELERIGFRDVRVSGRRKLDAILVARKRLPHEIEQDRYH